MQSKWKWLATGAAALAACVAVYVALNPYMLLIFSAKKLTPPTPSLLEGAGGSATRRHHSGCPPWEDFDLQNPGSIEDRVEQLFPLGTPDGEVVRSLSRQGFKIEPHCASDPTIRRRESRRL